MLANICSSPIEWYIFTNCGFIFIKLLLHPTLPPSEIHVGTVPQGETRIRIFYYKNLSFAEHLLSVRHYPELLACLITHGVDTVIGNCDLEMLNRKGGLDLESTSVMDSLFKKK